MDKANRHGYETSQPVTYGLLKVFARENRAHQTYAERLLWEELSNNRFKFKFRRQHIVGDFIADFICLKYNLIIEVDGGYHTQYAQQEEDALRTEVLNEYGFEVLRFTNDEIAVSASTVAGTIYDKIFEISNHDAE